MRIRFRLRTVMIIVAVLAVALGAERVWSRSSYCRRRAADYAAREASMLGLAAKREADVAMLRRRGEESRAEAEELDLDERRAFEEFADTTVRVVEMIDSDARGFRRKAAYFAKLKEKYSRLTARPWLPLEPDPPPPVGEPPTP